MEVEDWKNNKVIISNISHFLPLSTLKSMRLINAVWNAAVLPIFKKRSQTSIILKNNNTGCKKLKKFMDSMKNFGSIPNFSILLNNIENSDPREKSAFNFAALYTFTCFLRPNVVKLKLRVPFMISQDTEFPFGEILQHFSPNLEVLHLSFPFPFDKNGNIFFDLPPGIRFPKLKKLKDNSTDFNFESGWHFRTGPFFSKIFAGSPNLKNLSQAGKKLFFREIKNRKKPFPQLNSLAIQATAFYVKHVKLLIASQWKFKKLSIIFNCSEFGDNWALVEQLLEKNGSTLESLELRHITQAFKFPQMPKLTRLKVSFYKREGFRFKFIDFEPSNAANFFPKLETLSLREDVIFANYSEDDLKDNLVTIFPKECDHVFRGIRNLILPAFWKVLETVQVKNVFLNANIKYSFELQQFMRFEGDYSEEHNACWWA